MLYEHPMNILEVWKKKKSGESGEEGNAHVSYNQHGVAARVWMPARPIREG